MHSCFTLNICLFCFCVYLDFGRSFSLHGGLSSISCLIIRSCCTQHVPLKVLAFGNVNNAFIFAVKGMEKWIAGFETSIFTFKYKQCGR